MLELRMEPRQRRSERRGEQWLRVAAVALALVPSTGAFLTHSPTPFDVSLRMSSSPVDFHTVTVVESRLASADGALQHIKVESGGLFESYKTPGQYVQIKPPTPNVKPGFFALASPPDPNSNTAEFLIKRVDSTNWLCDLNPGDSVSMSAPQGKGFNIHNFDELGITKVLFFAAGSGIAPIRAAIESEELGLGKKVRAGTLYYGTRSPKHQAYADKFNDWHNNRQVKVKQIFSRGTVPLVLDAGYSGYIQQMFDNEHLTNTERTAALLCGMKGMCTVVQSQLLDKGIDKSRILYNF